MRPIPISPSSKHGEESCSCITDGPIQDPPLKTRSTIIRLSNRKWAALHRTIGCGFSFYLAWDTAVGVSDQIVRTSLLRWNGGENQGKRLTRSWLRGRETDKST